MPVSCGRYNVALVVSKEGNEAKILFYLSVFVIFIISIFLFIFFYFGEITFKKFFNAEELNFWWFLIPFAIFFNSIRMLVKSYLNRLKNYSTISVLKIFYATLKVTTLVILGYIGFTKNGLFVAELSTIIIIVLILIFYYVKDLFKKINPIKLKTFIDVAKKFKEFPIYGASSDTLNTIRAALPIFFNKIFFC